MRNTLPRFVIVLALLGAGQAFSGPTLGAIDDTKTAHYRIWQRLRFDSGQGQLQIQVDDRLTDKDLDLMWDGAADPTYALGKGHGRQFIDKPALPARLSSVDQAGRETSSFTFWKQAALAKVERSDFLEGGTPVYFVTSNDSAGFGSYSGKTTLLFTIGDSKLNELMALDRSGTSVPIVLAKRLKSDWRLLSNAPDLSEVEYVRCEPALKAADQNGDLQFKVIYTTYRKSGATWRLLEQNEHGFWESDQPFPERTKFP